MNSNVLFDFMLPLKPISNNLIKKEGKQKRKIKKMAICPFAEFQRIFSLLTKAGDVLPEEPIREKVNLTLFFDFKDNHERTLVNYEKAVTETLVKYRILASNNNRIVISNTQKMAKLTGDHYIRILIEKAVVNG